MKNRYGGQGGSFDSFDIKEYQINSGANKFDYDLFDEEKNLVQDVFRVKHSDTPKRGEKWKIFRNDELVFEIDGTKISKKDKIYLRSGDGINWLLKQCKIGLTTFSKFKIDLRNRK